MAYVYQKENVLVVQVRDGSKNLGNSVIVFLNDNLSISNPLANASISVSNEEIRVDSDIFPVILNGGNEQ